MPNRTVLNRHVACALAVLAVLALGITTPVEAAVTLDPQNPTNFTRDGGQSSTPGPALRLTDTSSGDYIAYFINDPDSIASKDLDLFATFQVITTTPNNADLGARVVISDGVDRSAIAECVIINGVRGIGLLSSIASPSNPAAYPVFVPVDWQALTSVQLRRTADGDAEIMEINGVAPSPRALLPAALAPGRIRAFPTVEFGSGSPEAEVTIDYSAFRTQLVPEPGSLGLRAGRLGAAAPSDAQGITYVSAVG